MQITLLNPIVLAYMIQSDGSFSNTRGKSRVRIYTNSFTKAEVKLLAEAAKKTNLNILENYFVLIKTIKVNIYTNSNKNYIYKI